MEGEAGRPNLASEAGAAAEPPDLVGLVARRVQAVEVAAVARRDLESAVAVAARRGLVVAVHAPDHCWNPNSRAVAVERQHSELVVVPVGPQMETATRQVAAVVAARLGTYLEWALARETSLIHLEAEAAASRSTAFLAVASVTQAGFAAAAVDLQRRPLGFLVVAAEPSRAEAEAAVGELQ